MSIIASWDPNEVIGCHMLSLLSIGDNMSPDFTISVLNFGVSIGLMGLIIVVIAVCLVVMTVALFRMKTTTEAAGTTEMESSVYEDVRAESHTIETMQWRIQLCHETQGILTNPSLKHCFKYCI